MKILFEGYHYHTEDLKDALGLRFHTSVSQSGEKRKINYVGYYCGEGSNTGLVEPVIIFPKVFLKYDHNGDNPKAFGHFNPEKIINVLEDEKLKQLDSDSVTPSLIYEMSVWLYRAIDKYRETYDKENITKLGTVNPVVSRNDSHRLTELEIIESLRLFYEENSTLFTFTSKRSNSQKDRIKILPRLRVGLGWVWCWFGVGLGQF